MEDVQELLSRKGTEVYTVHPEATVYEALEIMAERNIGAVIVVDEDGKIHGIFSERDYARKDMIKGRDSARTRVKEVMTTRVLSVNPETRIHECMALMTDQRVRHLPVLDGGRLAGVVSIGDVVKEYITLQEHTISQQAFQIHQLERYISEKP